ncbi:MAG: ABC transporter ATP-binding protein, partial [candidate division WOR-3 bacterium]
EFIGVIGPNGAGKSTLLRLMAGLLRPSAGRVSVTGRDIGGMSRREVARLVAVVPQESHFAFDYTVHDVVMMGRNPYLGRLERPGLRDLELVRKALDFVDARGLADKPVTQLSGGEKQRVVLARALAQETDLLLLDEPTAHLDIQHQESFVLLLKRLNSQGKTVVFSSHDLNLASVACSRILLLDNGRAAACDAPDKVLTLELIRSVYGVEPVLTRHPVTGRPQVTLTFTEPG